MCIYDINVFFQALEDNEKEKYLYKELWIRENYDVSDSPKQLVLCSSNLHSLCFTTCSIF